MKTFRYSLSLLLLFFLIVPSRAQDVEEMSVEELMHLADLNLDQYRKGEVLLTVGDASGKPVKGAKVHVNQISHDFLFGALLFDLAQDNIEEEREALFKERFLELFNYGILPFYWGGYEYTPGHPRWDRIEPVIDWCLENNITPKGHPLAWTHPAGMPDYVLDMSLEDSETLLEARIMENVAGYEDIAIWDVVNEPVNTVTWEMAHADKEARRRYRTDVPLTEIADWVENAYKAAHRANPEKHFVLNEFRQIADTVIRERFYRFVEELLERNTPINGLGIQAHEPRDEWFSPVMVWETLNEYAAFGLPVHVTEFSPQSKGAEITGGYMTGTWTEEAQADFAEMIYRLCFGHPSVVSINWWGFSDANAWLPGCGLTDEELNPKPVYKRLDHLINEEWMTKGLEIESTRKGEAAFRGFYGDYEISLTTGDGKEYVQHFHLTKGGENKWSFVTE